MMAAAPAAGAIAVSGANHDVGRAVTASLPPSLPRALSEHSRVGPADRRCHALANSLLLGTGACIVVASAGVASRRLRRRSTLRATKIQLEPGEKVVGVDLGTTNSVAAVLEAGRPTVVPNLEGARTTPSVVAYTKDGDLLVGEMAKRQGAVNPDNTFYSVKRFVGRQPSEVAEETRDVPYKVEAEREKVRLACPNLDRQLAPEEVSAQVLRKLSIDTAMYVKADVKKCVVTVPAYFNDSQRQATKDAGTIAGLQVLRIINEPTAASLAYGLDKKKNESILVFDLGGGTFDVSVLYIGSGIVEVMATCGDTKLGGDDFDRKIVEWLAAEFQRTEGIDLLQDRQALQRLTEAAEKAKVELSDLQEANISLPFIYNDENGPRHIDLSLTRKRFELLCADLIDRCRGPVEQALKDAELTANDINEVVLVGGSTRIPAVRALAQELSGGRYPNQTVNPDEVVAIGAALQGGVLTGDVTDLVLLDVTPLSLGVATHEGMTSVVIPRNTRIPAKVTKMYSTARENQPGVEVEVIQGERMRAKDNKNLGTFRLAGIPPAPTGVPQIEVTFDINADGVLSVGARDKVTLNSFTITIDSASTLAPEDLQGRVREAQAAAAGDKYARWCAEVRNSAEIVCYKLGRMLREYMGKIPEDRRMMLESKLMTLQDELDEEEPDFELIQKITADLKDDGKVVLKAKMEASGPKVPGGGLEAEKEELEKVRNGVDFGMPL